jgi:hypothetical protein
VLFESDLADRPTLAVQPLGRARLRASWGGSRHTGSRQGSVLEKLATPHGGDLALDESAGHGRFPFDGRFDTEGRPTTRDLRSWWIATSTVARQGGKTK